MYNDILKALELGLFGLLLNPWNLLIWIPSAIGIIYFKYLTTDEK